MRNSLTANRDFFRPANRQPAFTNESLGIEIYTWQENTSLYLKAFSGKRAKPDAFYRYGDNERGAKARQEYIDSFIRENEERAARKIQRREEAKAFQNTLKVGDIFVSTWGYDQTNVDYYEVVALVGKCFVEILEIAQVSEGSGDMTGSCVPAPGQFLTVPDYESEESKAHRETHGHYLQKAATPRRVKVQAGYQGEPCITLSSFQHGSLKKPIFEKDGVKVFSPDHWTAYA